MLTALVALAMVDGAGSFVNIDVDGTTTKLRIHNAVGQGRADRGRDSRNGVDMQPHRREKLNPLSTLPIPTLQLLWNRLGHSDQPDLLISVITLTIRAKK